MYTDTNRSMQTYMHTHSCLQKEVFMFMLRLEISEYHILLPCTERSEFKLQQRERETEKWEERERVRDRETERHTERINTI